MRNRKASHPLLRRVTLVGGAQDGEQVQVMNGCFEVRGTQGMYAVRPIDATGNAIGVYHTLSLERALNMVLDYYAEAKLIESASDSTADTEGE